MAHHIFLFALLTIATLASVCSIEYVVTDLAHQTPGGDRFDREIGISLTQQLMGTVNTFIWYNIFQQRNPIDRKYNDHIVYLNVKDDIAQDFVAVTLGNTINVSTRFIQDVQGDLKWEFTSLLYQVMTFVFQWTGGNTAPTGLKEGIADYVRLKSNYIHSNEFIKPGEGDRWDQGSEVTARFLEYCEGLRGGFVAELNKKMRIAYSEHYFIDLLEKPVGQLWDEYKAISAKTFN